LAPGGHHKKKAETSWDTVIEAKAMAAYVLPKKKSVNLSSWVEQFFGECL
jgi:hypothetical protein